MAARKCIILYSCISVIGVGLHGGLSMRLASTEQSTPLWTVYSPEPITDFPIGPFADDSTGPFKDYFTGPLADYSTGPFTDYFTGPFTDYFTGPFTEQPTENTSEQVTEESIKQTTEQASVQGTDPSTGQRTGQSTEHATEGASTELATELSTIQTTELATTVPPVVQCYDGTCLANVSDDVDYNCISANITDMCDLTDGASCFQTVYKYNFDIIYEVGCTRDCEYNKEQGKGTDTISITRCCDTHACNSRRINDPENSAISVTSSIFAVVCLFVFII